MKLGRYFITSPSKLSMFDRYPNFTSPFISMWNLVDRVAYGLKCDFTKHSFCIVFFGFGTLNFFHDIIHVQGFCTLWCIPPLCAIKNHVSISQFSIGVQFNLGIIFPQAPFGLCGYFLELLSSSLLISGGGYVLSWQWGVGVKLIQLFWVRLVLCRGVALVSFFIVVELVLIVLDTTIAMSHYLRSGANIPRSLDPTMLGHTIFGLETGRDDNQSVSPSNKIFESWIGCSWCRLNSNRHSSDTPTGVMSGECNRYCWCGLNLN